MYQNICKLDSKQIARLYQVVDTHHRIERAIFIGDGRFKVETDKRSFIACLSKDNTEFVLEGIKLGRDEK